MRAGSVAGAKVWIVSSTVNLQTNNSPFPIESLDSG